MVNAPQFTDRLSTATDALLVERTGDGDVAAFEVLARRYGPVMRTYARRLTGSGADADDVVQESFVQAWKQLGNLRDGNAVKNWLMRIVGHRSIDYLRRRRDQFPLEDHLVWSDPAPIPEHTAVLGATMAALSTALGKLPDEQRQCWVLKEMGGQSYGEIAEALNISITSVRGRLARARTTLMTEMENWR